jgi:cbb3-type cytochrome oxidase subunit 3
VLRLGAALGLLGFVVQIVMDRLHPHRVAPNDSVNVFREYAGSHDWTAVHIGQFLGTLLIVLAFVALARTLARQRGLAGALAVVATVTAVLVAAVFAVQMAVDGVALKAAIQAWTAAPTPVDQAATFQVAESVRWTEKGLGGFFQILNGATLLCLGCSIALGDRYPTWLGLVGAVAGVGFLAGGVATAHTGFSPGAGRLLLPGTVLLAVFLIGVVVLMWRRGGRRPAA